MGAGGGAVTRPSRRSRAVWERPLTVGVPPADARSAGTGRPRPRTAGPRRARGLAGAGRARVTQAREAGDAGAELVAQAVQGGSGRPQARRVDRDPQAAAPRQARRRGAPGRRDELPDLGHRRGVRLRRARRWPRRPPPRRPAPPAGRAPRRARRTPGGSARRASGPGRRPGRRDAEVAAEVDQLPPGARDPRRRRPGGTAPAAAHRLERDQQQAGRDDGDQRRARVLQQATARSAGWRSRTRSAAAPSARRRCSRWPPRPARRRRAGAARP